MSDPLLFVFVVLYSTEISRLAPCGTLVRFTRPKLDSEKVPSQKSVAESDKRPSLPDCTNHIQLCHVSRDVRLVGCFAAVADTFTSVKFNYTCDHFIIYLLCA